MGCHHDQVGRLCGLSRSFQCVTMAAFVLYSTGQSHENLATFSRSHKKKSSLERPWGSVGQLYDRRVDPEKVSLQFAPDSNWFRTSERCHVYLSLKPGFPCCWILAGIPSVLSPAVFMYRAGDLCVRCPCGHQLVIVCIHTSTYSAAVVQLAQVYPVMS